MARSTIEQDRDDLAGFGYRQRLDRSLGSFSAFAAGFSYLSVLTGTTQLFHLGYGAGGPAFVWTWPVVTLGQFLVALGFAELAARYPVAGGVYQWSRQLAPGTVGRLAGWVYLACAIITLASVALALQATLPRVSPLFQWVYPADDPAAQARNAVWLGGGLVLFSTALNTIGLRLLARLNNLGVIAELIGAIALVGLLGWHAQRGPAVIFETQGRGLGHPLGYLAPALAAAVMASFVLYGFDTAGTLAEETTDPRRRAPWAILLALGSVGVMGTLLVVNAVRAAPDLTAPELASAGGGLSYVVDRVLGGTLARPLLVVMAFAVVVCTVTVHAAAVRLVFAMARDGQLPMARSLARVDARSGTPVLPALLIGLAALAVLGVDARSPHVIETLTSTAVVWANLAYLFVSVPLLVRRTRARDRWRPEPGTFHLGRWGLPVNLAAVAWGVLLVLNTGWPRPEIYGGGWSGRLGAAPATAVMLLAGWIFARRGRRRAAVVLDDHRAPARSSVDAWSDRVEVPENRNHCP